MADGSYKNIEKISVGDYVLSYDEEDKKTVKSKVVQNFKRESDSYYLINKNLKVTGEHPFAKAAGDVTKVEESVQTDAEGNIHAYSCSYCVDTTWAWVSIELGVFVVSDTHVSCEFPCICVELDGKIMTEADLLQTIESLGCVQLY